MSFSKITQLTNFARVIATREENNIKMSPNKRIGVICLRLACPDHVRSKVTTTAGCNSSTNNFSMLFHKRHHGYYYHTKRAKEGGLTMSSFSCLRRGRAGKLRRGSLLRLSRDTVNKMLDKSLVGTNLRKTLHRAESFDNLRKSHFRSASFLPKINF